MKKQRQKSGTLNKNILPIMEVGDAGFPEKETFRLGNTSYCAPRVGWVVSYSNHEVSPKKTYQLGSNWGPVASPLSWTIVETKAGPTPHHSGTGCVVFEGTNLLV